MEQDKWTDSEVLGLLGEYATGEIKYDDGGLMSPQHSSWCVNANRKKPWRCVVIGGAHQNCEDCNRNRGVFLTCRVHECANWKPLWTTLSYCHTAGTKALALQSELNSETCTESRITVYSVYNMFNQLSERNQLHHITSERSDGLRQTNIHKILHKTIFNPHPPQKKNTGRPRMHQMKWCKCVWEWASSFCSIFLTQSRARASACLSKKWLIIISALLVSTEMPQPSCRLLLDEENAIKTSSAFY